MVHSLRYCYENRSSSSSFRKYANGIPVFLTNRPKELVKHCMQKIAEASRHDKTGIVELGNGKFRTTSFQENSRDIYELFFGDEHNLPRCTCESWKKSAYPCKHFFAVMQKFTEWSWNRLSPLYINSPYLCLDSLNDDENIKICKIAVNPVEHLETSVFPEVNDLINDDDVMDEVEADEKPPMLRSANSCRIKLKAITELTFSIEDNLVELTSLFEKLSTIESHLKTYAPAEKGLLLRSKNKKPDIWKSKRFSQIPIRKKPKLEKQTKRVGENKEKRVAASAIKVNPLDVNELDVAEEVINESFIKGESPPEFVLVTKQKPELSDPIIIEDDEPERSEQLKSVSTSMRSLLNISDLKTISENEMLTDNVIFVMQKMMSAEYSNVNGFQDPILGQTRTFSIMKSMPFVQVLHDGRLHWIAVSTYNCPPGTIKVFDSNFHGQVSVEVKKQICSILHSDHPKIKLSAIPVQQQSNPVDCGLYALAFIQYVAINKKDPTGVRFDQARMRSHTLHCLTANKIKPFPTFNATKEIPRQCKAKTFKLQIYCSCRMYWVPSDENIFSRYYRYFIFSF